MFQATIAAAITEKSPFATPMNRKEEANLAKAALSVANSDHLTIYNAYLGYGTSATSLLRLLILSAFQFQTSTNFKCTPVSCFYKMPLRL